MKQIDFLQILSQNRDLVWPLINQYLTQFTRYREFPLPSKYTSLVDFHSQIVSDYPQRKGKYLRPTLVLLTAQSLGVSLNLALPVAAAMQTSEDWILNHDDIEDDSLERRGRPTLHQIHGKELAINAGDSLHVLMWKILADTLPVLGEKLYLRIINEFYQILNRTTLGQTIEIKWTRENRFDLTDEDIYLISESKICYYTIAGPMRLGAILANVADSQLSSLYHFGVKLGRSFQIIDDLLDLTSDFAGLKKQRGNDIYEGKRTIILIHLYRHATPADKKTIISILSKTRSQKTPSEVDWVIAKMEKYGSLDYAKDQAIKFAQQAKKIFQKDLKFLKNQPFRDQIISGIDFVVNRTH